MIPNHDMKRDMQSRHSQTRHVVIDLTEFTPEKNSSRIDPEGKKRLA